MTVSKVKYVESASEGEKAALAAAKEHERQWRDGYEQLYGKYSHAKEQLAQMEHQVGRERADAEAKVRRVVRKAERAIRFFKDAAFERGGLGKSADGKAHEQPERLPRTVGLKVQAGR